AYCASLISAGSPNNRSRVREVGSVAAGFGKKVCARGSGVASKCQTFWRKSMKRFANHPTGHISVRLRHGGVMPTRFVARAVALVLLVSAVAACTTQHHKKTSTGHFHATRLHCR